MYGRKSPKSLISLANHIYKWLYRKQTFKIGDDDYENEVCSIAMTFLNGLWTSLGFKYNRNVWVTQSTEKKGKAVHSLYPLPTEFAHGYFRRLNRQTPTTQEKECGLQNTQPDVLTRFSVMRLHHHGGTKYQ